MERRQLLKNIGAGGLLSLGVGTAAAERSNGATATDLDAVHVEREGTVVATLDDPSQANLRRLHAELDSSEELVTPEECCLVECKGDCIDCDYGCCDYMYDC